MSVGLKQGTISHHPARQSARAVGVMKSDPQRSLTSIGNDRPKTSPETEFQHLLLSSTIKSQDMGKSVAKTDFRKTEAFYSLDRIEVFHKSDRSITVSSLDQPSIGDLDPKLDLLKNRSTDHITPFDDAVSTSDKAELVMRFKPSVASVFGELVTNHELALNLSAFEQMNAVSFDRGPLLGHATNEALITTTHAQIELGNVKGSETAISKDTLTNSGVQNRKFSGELTEQPHYLTPQLYTPEQHPSDLALLYEDVARAGRTSSSQMGNREIVQPVVSFEVGQLRARLTLPMIPDQNQEVSQQVVTDSPAEAPAQQSASQVSKLARLMASNYTSLSPVLVAIHSLEQGIHVFARIGKLSIGEREKLNDEMLKAMTEFGLNAEDVSVTLEERRHGQNKRGSSQ